MTDTRDTAENALTFLRQEKKRLSQIIDAVDALYLASGRINKAGVLAKEAGEILIEGKIAQVQSLIASMIGDLFEGRKHKTHAELDAMMEEKVNIHAA